MDDLQKQTRDVPRSADLTLLARSYGNFAVKHTRCDRSSEKEQSAYYSAYYSASYTNELSISGLRLQSANYSSRTPRGQRSMSTSSRHQSWQMWGLMLEERNLQLMVQIMAPLPQLALVVLHLPSLFLFVALEVERWPSCVGLWSTFVTAVW